jgi:four helix bundle protein
MSVDKVIRSFEDLEVFQRAYRISLDIHRASLNFPKIEQYALADQVRRASKAICANLAEGFAKQRRSSAEYRRFLQMAIGSADEMRVWLRNCLDLGYIDEPTWAGWRDEYQQVARMLTALHAAWRRSRQDTDG